MKKILTLVSLVLFSSVIQAQCFKVISAGNYYSLAIHTNGTLWAWGKNARGQMGDTFYPYGSSIPVQIGTDNNWKSVSAGAEHSLGIKTDGTLWGWGDNSNGELGNGIPSGFDFKKVPTQIGSDTNWIAASAGDMHSVGLKSNGTLWSWGSNFRGALGDGTTVSRGFPTRIGTATNWQSTSAGYEYTMAIQNNGTLWGWGLNAGKLGAKLGNQVYSPTQIGVGTNWKQVDAGESHTMAIKTNGTLWASGNNFRGVLGIGSTVSTIDTLTQVGTSTNWRSVSVGTDFTVAIQTAGSLWSWGANDYGQLGDGTKTLNVTPTMVGTATDWSIVSARNKHSLTTKTDNTIWAWGWNIEGQVGDGTSVDKLSPVKISNCFSELGVHSQSASESKFILFPNPAGQVIAVKNVHQLPIDRMDILDVTGRLILTSKFKDQSIDIRRLSPGIFILHIYSGNIRFQYRFVKN